MERFKRFTGRRVVRARLDDPELLRAAHLEVRWLPERFEALDEMEFAAPLEGGRKLVVSFVLEEGRIQRMLAGRAEPGDDEDAMRPMEEDELRAVLEHHGAAIVKFLEAVTTD